MASGKSKSAKEVTSVFGTLVRVAEPEDTGGPTCVRVKTVKKSGKEEDVQEENGVLFWVNKSGFPIDDKTWDRMWDHVARIHPDGYDVIHKVRDKKDLPSVPIPHPPTNFSASVPISERLDRIQNYMRTLQYNHTGTQFFEIRKKQTYLRIARICKRNDQRSTAHQMFGSCDSRNIPKQWISRCGEISSQF